MSTKENLELVKRGYELFAKGDIPGLLEMQADDVVWEIGTGAGEGIVPHLGTYRGRDGVGKFFQIYGGAVEVQEFEAREFLADGDKVVVLGHAKEKAKPTGKTYEFDWTMVFTVRDGKTTAMRSFSDTAASVAAWQGA